MRAPCKAFRNMPLRLRKLKRSKDEKALDLFEQAEGKWLLFQEKKGHSLFKSALSTTSKRPLFHAKKAAVFYELSFCEPKYLPVALSSIEDALKGDPNCYAYKELKAAICDLQWNESKKPSDYIKAAEAYTSAIDKADSLQKRAEIQWDLALLYLSMGTLSSEPVESNRAYELLEAIRGTYHKNRTYLYDLVRAYFTFTDQITSESINQKALRTLNYLIEEYPSEKRRAIPLFAKAHMRTYQSNLKKQSLDAALDFFALAKPLKKDEKLFLSHWASVLYIASELSADPVYLKHGVEKLKLAHAIAPRSEEITLQLIEGLAKLSLFEDSKEHIHLMTELISYQKDFQAKGEISPPWSYVQGLYFSTLAFYYDSKEFYEKAIDAFDIALAIEPTQGLWWHAKGCTYLGRSNSDRADFSDLSKAAYAFDKAYHLQPCLPYQMDYALSMYKLAEYKESLELSEKAYTIFSSAFSSSSADYKYDWVFHYGSATRLLGQLSGSEALLFQAINVFKSLPEGSGLDLMTQFELGMCYACLGDLLWDAKFLEKAIRFFSNVTQIDKEFEPAYFEQALAYIQLGTIAKDTPHHNKEHSYWATAEKRLVHCARLGSMRAFYSLACLYSLTGMIQNALIYFKKAKAYGFLPSLEQILNDPWLENLRKSSEFNPIIEDL